MRLEGLDRTGVEVVQFEVVFALQREAEPLGPPLLLPEHILREAAGAGTDVRKVEEVILAQLVILGGGRNGGGGKDTMVSGGGR